MKKILIVGSANVDLSIHVKQIPAVGETVLGKSMERLPGGKGANQACAVGKLGGIGCFLCAVGSDDAGPVSYTHLYVYKRQSSSYDVYYRVHSQTFGWLDWACNGQSAGSAGYAKRIEAIQIVLVKKGGAAPGSTATPYKEAPPSVTYQTYISGGWQPAVCLLYTSRCV